MSLLSVSFGAPFILLALLFLPLIWWLNRLTPPKPNVEPFPPFAILLRVLNSEDTPASSPWWITLLRTLICAFVILALSEPILNKKLLQLDDTGPLVIVLDEGWSGTTDWDQRVETVYQLVDQAERNDTPVLLTFTTSTPDNLELATADQARKILATVKPKPLHPLQTNIAGSISTALNGKNVGTLALILGSTSIKETKKSLQALFDLSAEKILVFKSDQSDIIAINSATNEADFIEVQLQRLHSGNPAALKISAYDAQSRIIVQQEAHFETGEKKTDAQLHAPFELLNDVVRIKIEDQEQAAASYLLDDRFRRRRIAVFSGETNEIINPLLTSAHYIERAALPFAELLNTDNINLTTDIKPLLAQQPSAIVLSDIGTFEATVASDLSKWVRDGGTLIRFAGPKLAAAEYDPTLLPVRLRQGERQLGGALSWEQPKTLAEFEADSPFFGVPISDEIKIKRQVLAEPSLELSDRTWASLTDGTPLVTARSEGAGRVILFHVNSETSWSNLPLSGTFAEMLRRTINLSKSTLIDNSSRTATSFLPVYKGMTAKGTLTSSVSDLNPLEFNAENKPIITPQTRPGLYGTEDSFLAINLMSKSETLQALKLPEAETNIQISQIVGDAPSDLKPWLLSGVFIFLLADALIVLIMSGTFSKRRAFRAHKESSATLIIALTFAILVSAGNEVARAQDVKMGDVEIIERLETTHLAYVKTGNVQIDRISELGLTGLNYYLRTRTALEPGGPAALDLEEDELSFYPLIYWPISENAPLPSRDAMGKIETFMKQGGTILFDTRDELSGFGTTGRPSSRTLKLREILFDLDVPPLEPVPDDHVLTKSFYLLNHFPGRYANGELWVEALSPDRNESSRPVHSADGVTPIMITSNDLAGAWALDSSGRPVLPTVPHSDRQRTLAIRTGINIVMYMLTGNYKADQVHLPALLERLGQ